MHSCCLQEGVCVTSPQLKQRSGMIQSLIGEHCSNGHHARQRWLQCCNQKGLRPTLADVPPHCMKFMCATPRSQCTLKVHAYQSKETFCPLLRPCISRASCAALESLAASVTARRFEGLSLCWAACYCIFTCDKRTSSSKLMNLRTRMCSLSFGGSLYIHFLCVLVSKSDSLLI